MNIKKIILSLACLIAIATSSFSTAAGYRDDILSAVSQYEKSSTFKEYENCIKRFAILSESYPEEWLPLYYSALLNIEAVYLNEKEEVSTDEKKAFLDKSLKHLEKLKSFPAADQSETNTLMGFHLATLVKLNPRENGAKYYADVLSFYRKAMEINPSNPRPVCLNAMFCQYMPANFRQGINIEDEKKKAQQLFEKEHPSNGSPAWGKIYLNYIHIQ
jgi:hypothetical protein